MTWAPSSCRPPSIAGAPVAFALGDGTVRFAGLTGGEEDWASVTVHDGAVLALAADAEAGSFVTGGDDGDFRRVKPDGEAVTLADSARNGWSRSPASCLDWA